jgi:hypothetical protein
MAKKRCHYCGKFFTPDPRVGNLQKACSIECQKLRKKENNRAFSKNNPEYWHGRYEYVKEWRMRNPDYQKQWRQKRKAKKKCEGPTEIQAEIFGKALDRIEKNLMLLREIQAEIIIKAIDIQASRRYFPFQAL